MNENTGTVYWITGLSGAGKTTIATALYEQLKVKCSNLVLLDGDILRQSVATELGYTREDRVTAAVRYARLCKMLADQGIIVIIGTISMFNSVRDWNRENIKKYNEIYLEVPMEVLYERNQKNLYKQQNGIKNENVAGRDIKIEYPDSPNLIIKNDGSRTVEECVTMIMEQKNK